MIRTPTLTRTAPVLLAALALGLGIAACGDDDDSSDDSTSRAAAANTAGGNTVSARSVSGVGSVLVDAKGMVLYTNDQDTPSKIACSDECAAIWIPLTLPAGTSAATGPPDVQSKLGVVTDPAGDQQVTLDGKPLYSFAMDGPGEASGNGLTDSFGGTTFTWTVAGAGGSSAGGGGPTSPSSPSGSGGGDYGY